MIWSVIGVRRVSRLSAQGGSMCSISMPRPVSLFGITRLNTALCWTGELSASRTLKAKFQPLSNSLYPCDNVVFVALAVRWVVLYCSICVSSLIWNASLTDHSYVRLIFTYLHGTLWRWWEAVWFMCRGYFEVTVRVDWLLVRERLSGLSSLPG